VVVGLDVIDRLHICAIMFIHSFEPPLYVSVSKSGHPYVIGSVVHV